MFDPRSWRRNTPIEAQYPGLYTGPFAFNIASFRMGCRLRLVPLGVEQAAGSCWVGVELYKLSGRVAVRSQRPLIRAACSAH